MIFDQHCYHCNQTVSSYQHEFFECGIMPQMWACINSLLDSAQLPARLQSIADLPEFLFDAHNPEFNLRRIVNTNLVIITLKAVWDAYQNKKDMNQQQYRDDIRRRLAMYITNEIKLLPWHLDNVHKHAMIIRPNAKPRRMYTEREKMLLRKPSPRSHSLTDKDITAYRDIWLPIGVITIADDERSIAICITPRLPP